jgi:hypothetical protein
MANRLLHIGDLDDQVSVETLKSAFITFGDIVNISIPKAIASKLKKHFEFLNI